MGPEDAGMAPGPAEAEAEGLFRTIVEISPNIVIVHRDGVLLYANPAALEAVGASDPDELVGRPVADFVHPDSATVVRERIRGMLETGEPAGREIETYLSLDGTPFKVEAWASPIIYGGKRSLLVVAQDITERLALRRTLSESEERYHLLFENADDAIYVIGVDGVIKEANPSAHEMLGYAPGELCGKTLGELDAPEFVETGRERMSEILQRGRAVFEALHVRADGARVPVEVSARQVEYAGESAVLGFARDISERTRAEAALRRSERLMRAIVDSSPLGMHFYRLEDDGRLVFDGSNPAAEIILGVDHEHLAGMTIEEAWPGLVGTDVQDAYRRVARDGAVWANEDVVYDEEGRISASFDVHAFQTGPGGMVAAFEDITERKRAERELELHRQHLEELVGERTAELEESNRELEAATEAKSAFLASMSHELRTPLNSIIGFSGLMLQGMAGPLTDEQRRQMEMVNHSGRQLLALIGDVLDLAKIEAGRVEVVLSPFSVPHLVGTLVETLRPAAEERGLALSVDLDAAPVQMIADRTKLEQILMNLLSNALKYTDEGGAAVKVRDCGDGMAEFEVRDTGQGILSEDRERIFEEFRQLPALSGAKNPGTGLGLAISRRLAGLLGGTISLDSEPSRGSTFTLRVPLEPADSEATLDGDTR